MKAHETRVGRLEAATGIASCYSHLTDAELEERCETLKLDLAAYVTPACGWDAPMPEILAWLRSDLKDAT